MQRNQNTGKRKLTLGESRGEICGSYFFGREKFSCLYEKGGIDMFDFCVKVILVLMLMEALGYIKEKSKGEHKRNKNKKN